MFEFYQGTASENTAPKITVRKGGQLVLTSGAVAMLGDDVDHVQLGYDRKTKVVGIRGAGEDAEGRYRLRSQKNSSRLCPDSGEVAPPTSGPMPASA